MNISQEILTHEPSGSANGASTMHELFALSDEQILEIEPEAQDVEVSGAEPGADEAAGSKAGASTRSASERGATAETPAATDSATSASGASAPPAWLAEQMSDPRNGSAARELWNGVQRSQQEAAAFREIFAQPGDARAAAERSRVLDEVDRAYFGGTGQGAADAGASRAQLAQTLLREDPVAFREMVFAGLRALEEGNGGAPNGASATTGSGSSSGVATSTGANGGATREGTNRTDAGHVDDRRTATSASGQRSENSGATSPQQEALVAQYAAFERSANEELERSVGSVIDRTLAEALPNSGRSENSSLHGRLAASIRQDIEKELQGDRRLGEQVAAILAAPRAGSGGASRFGEQARTQLVRVIGERARQLVPSVARRVLGEWTHTTIARNRQTSVDSRTSAAQKGATPAQTGSTQRGTDRANRASSTTAARPSRKVDYQRVSDEQLLDS
jgi:hypothetical protein